jgi:hypothetical protein
MASPQTSVSQSTVTDDLLNDERWLLVQRIVSSAPFQKGTRLRDLLQYLTKQTIHGHAHELTEQHIGNALFHKPSDYSPLEDSSVRVHARQLRLKLHEYFDEEGRNEPLILSIPKGSYTPIFKPATKAASSLAVALGVSPAVPRRTEAILAWALCGVLVIVCAVLVYRTVRRGTPGPAESATNPPWPFSQVFDSRHQTLIVVADSNYGMFRILTSQPGSLEQYLRRDFLQSSSKARPGGGADFRLNEYMTNSALTSFADVADVATLLEMAWPFQKKASVRYPRDLAMRDLDHENYVLIGSPGSNPWVSLFQTKLNFRESEAVVGNSAKAFVNTSPLPGEKDRYEGLRWTGSMGEDYATIALLPNVTHDGSVLVMQGLQQEGTEAAGRFLADPENRRQLKAALGITGSRETSVENIWFEALIHSRTVAGAPNSTTLVSVRRID